MITQRMYNQADDERIDELQRLLSESTAVLEWHLSKSRPIDPTDQSDFFNMTANAIVANNKAIHREEPQQIDFDNLPF